MYQRYQNRVPGTGALCAMLRSVAARGRGRNGFLKSQGIREIASITPIKLKVLEQLIALAVRFLWARHFVVAADNQLIGDFHPQKAVMVVRIALECHRIALLIVEHHWRDHTLPIDLHDRMKIVIAAGSDDEVRDLHVAGHILGQALIVVNVACQNHFRMPARLLGGMFERVLHIRAAGMMIIRGIDRMVQRYQQWDLGWQGPQLVDQPLGLQRTSVAASRNIAVEPNDVYQRCQ